MEPSITQQRRNTTFAYRVNNCIYLGTSQQLIQRTRFGGGLVYFSSTQLMRCRFGFCTTAVYSTHVSPRWRERQKESPNNSRSNKEVKLQDSLKLNTREMETWTIANSSWRKETTTSSQLNIVTNNKHNGLTGCGKGFERSGKKLTLKCWSLYWLMSV